MKVGLLTNNGPNDVYLIHCRTNSLESQPKKNRFYTVHCRTKTDKCEKLIAVRAFLLNMAGGELTRFARPADSPLRTVFVVAINWLRQFEPGREYSFPRRSAICEKSRTFVQLFLNMAVRGLTFFVALQAPTRAGFWFNWLRQLSDPISGLLIPTECSI